MIRYTILLILSLSAVVVISIWFSDRPGQVSIEWQGWLIQLSTGKFVLGFIICVTILVALLSIIRLIIGVPDKLRRKRRSSRRARGYLALTRGMVAVAAGDPNEADRQARRADLFLNDPPLTMLLSAQAAQLNGDEAAAERYFKSMLDKPETAFLGVRGLLIQAQKLKDKTAVIKYVEQAYRLRPNTPWVLTSMFDLQVSERNWPTALTTLEQMIKHKTLSVDDARKRRAIVLLGCSEGADGNGDLPAALRFANKSVSIDPHFLPAVLRSTDLLVRMGKSGKASRLINKIWKISPHPDLARVYGEIDEPKGTLKKVKRLQKLLEINSSSVESHLAVAKAALQAELWGEARTHLEAAIEINPTVRVYRQLADLEERSGGGIDAASSWLISAASAAPDPAWVCNACAAVWREWSPVCSNCQAFGSFAWRAPEPMRDLAFENANANDEAQKDIADENVNL